VVEHIRYNASDNPLIEKDFISHLNSSQAEFQIIVLRGLGQIKVENFNRITKLITTDSAVARRLLQDLFVTDADILPDPENNRLRIRVHNTSLPSANRSLTQLFDRLNDAEVTYPGTEMKITYELVGRGE
jgi:hypothetical protein